jgi:lambda family phage portal protein
MTPEQMRQFARDYEAAIGPLTPTALGGAFEAAARFDKQIGAWSPAIRSADADILPDKSLLDARSRDMARNDANIQWGVEQHKDSVVGSFYLLNSKPEWEILGKTEEWAEAFQEEVETKFSLWAESPQKWVDASRTNTLTEMIRLGVGVSVFTGEILATAEWMNARGRDYRTAIQLVDTDRLSSPPEALNNPRVRAGIESDSFGAPIAAFIRTQHPSDYRLMFPGSGQWWKRVSFRKTWGRQMVLFLKDQQRIDQTRAISMLTAGLRGTAIGQKFRDISLQNAVINASYAAVIESELPSEVVFSQLGQGADYGEAITEYASSYMAQVAEWVGRSKNLQIDGAKIPHLFPGTKFNLQPMGTPGGIGQEFEASLMRYTAASLGLTYEEFTRDFSKTNYSSLRGAMLSTWRFMQARKKVFADGMANFVYRLWLEEAINNDRLETFRASEAPMLYTDGYLNLMFDGLANGDWIGAARGQIDELKETQAATLRIKSGLSTREDELSRQGKDWRKVFRQIAREQQAMKDMGIVLEGDDKMMNAATGSPREEGEQDARPGDAAAA